jgi:hypothetical protein
MGGVCLNEHVLLTVCCNLLQELTKLRITNLEGIDKPQTAAVAA